MWSKILLGLPVFVIGGAISLQSLVNAGLASRLGSSLIAATVSFWVGTIALTIASVASGGIGPALANARGIGLGWWIGGGVLGASFVTVITMMVPRLGVAVTIAFVIAGQLLAAAALDHFGALGAVEHPITLARMAGIGLLIAGALIIRFA